MRAVKVFVSRASVCVSIGCSFNLRVVLVCVGEGGVSVVCVLCELDIYSLYLRLSKKQLKINYIYCQLVFENWSPNAPNF
jgi:hypothetical protein